MNITVIAVGKIKESFFRDAIAEYSKRLGRYCRLNIIEVDDEKTPDDAGETETDRILKKEADRIIQRIPDGSHVITLEIRGHECTSEELASHISDLGVRGVSHITFIIGGSLGLHSAVISLAKEHLSFSELTFPHQLMRVFLLEQIFRAFKINNNEKYHH